MPSPLLGDFSGKEWVGFHGNRCELCSVKKGPWYFFLSHSLSCVCVSVCMCVLHMPVPTPAIFFRTKESPALSSPNMEWWKTTYSCRPEKIQDGSRGRGVFLWSCFSPLQRLHAAERPLQMIRGWELERCLVVSKGQMMQNNKWYQSGQGKVHWFSGSMQSMQPSSAVRKGPRPAQIWTQTHREL